MSSHIHPEQLDRWCRLARTLQLRGKLTYHEERDLIADFPRLYDEMLLQKRLRAVAVKELEKMREERDAARDQLAESRFTDYSRM